MLSIRIGVILEGNVFFAISSALCVVGSYLSLLAVMAFLSWRIAVRTAQALQRGITPAWLFQIAVAAQIATLLFHKTFFSGYSDLAVIVGRSDAFVRGWPFAWLGLTSSWESLLIPFYICANWLVWTMITCVAHYFVYRFASVPTLERFASLLAFIAVIGMAILLPLLILPLNALGYR